MANVQIPDTIKAEIASLSPADLKLVSRAVRLLGHDLTRNNNKIDYNHPRVNGLPLWGFVHELVSLTFVDGPGKDDVTVVYFSLLSPWGSVTGPLREEYDD